MSTPQRKTLSATMLCYNDERFVGRAIAGMLAQSRLPDELIIVDDGSTDRSPEIIQSYAKKHSFIRHVRNERNLGIHRSLFVSLDNASGEYIYCGASDDIILPDLFERSMNMLEQYPEAGICTSLSVIIDADDNNQGLVPMPIISDTPCFVPPETGRRLLMSCGNWYIGTSAIWKKSAYQATGVTVPETLSFTDNMIFLEVALKHGACFIPEVMSTWRIIGTGYASTVFSDRQRYFHASRHVMSLLEGKYAELLPAGFVERWQQWNDYTFYHANYMNNTEHKQEAFALATEGNGILGRAVKIICSLAPSLQYQLVRLALAARFKLLRPGYLHQKRIFKRYDRKARQINVAALRSSSHGEQHPSKP